MMSVLMECGEDAGALGITLASLVPGAIEGLVREVVVLDRGMDAATHKVADHAGCRLVPTARLPEAISAAKGTWLMLIEPGARLSPDWVEGVAAYLSEAMAGGEPKPARFTPVRHDRPPLWKRFTRARGGLANGLILPKGTAIGRSERAGSLAELAKGMVAVRLDAAIRPRPGS